MPLKIGQIVRLTKIPNHPCTALEAKHVGLEGLVMFDDRRDDLGRTAYTVSFKGLGHVYVTGDMVEIVKDTPSWNS